MSPEAAVNAVARHLRILWRAESLIAEIRLRGVVQRSVIYVVAALIGVFGLVMLNMAAYAWLTPLWGGVWAALAVALGDFVIAGILVLIAGRDWSDPQLALATEMRDQAVETIESDMRIVRGEMTGFLRNPLSLSGPMGVLIIRLIRSILKARGDHKST
jgi:Putative Actinobacterial Holin-X, holin superfamily III